MTETVNTVKILLVNPPAANEATIDELATQVGLPTRTIREYQRLNLLPPPRRVGRVGMYGPDHQARLSVIRRLQDRGYSLAAVGDLMGSWEQGRGLGSILGVDANPAVLDETPTEISAKQLRQFSTAFADPAFLIEAEAVGLLRRTDAGFLVRSLAALELVGLVIEAGMPEGEALALAQGISTGAAAIAGDAVARFVEHLWPRRDQVDLAKGLARARLLLAQASASLVVHELGIALAAHAQAAPELLALVDRITIGQVRRLPQEET